MADWKYVMFEVDGRKCPVIFPNELIHEDVARMLYGLVQQAYNGPAMPVSAGFISALQVISTDGRSEMLNMDSEPGDAKVINSLPYTNGREDIMNTHLLTGVAFMELLLKQLKG